MEDLSLLRKYMTTAISLAKEAGILMQNASGKNKKIDEKSSFNDLVTETDKAVEELVFNNLKTLYPDHEFIGEESYDKKNELTDKPTWIIDPIDGTTNFIHQFDFCCISIGLVIEKKIVLGVVYSPFLNKLYTAIKGQGAFLNGKPISTKPIQDLDKALIIFDMTCSSPRAIDFKVLNYKGLAGKCHGFRQVGSAALSICCVAEGSCEAYFEQGIHCWDIAGGAIILTEAGGYVCDTNGEPFDMMSRRILVSSTPELAKKIYSNLKTIAEIERD